MSYCRGEVYDYRSGEGRYSIHVSPTNEPHEDYFIEGIGAFRDKMLELKARGLDVPDRVFERIEREIAEGRK